MPLQFIWEFPFHSIMSSVFTKINPAFTERIHGRELWLHTVGMEDGKRHVLFHRNKGETSCLRPGQILDSPCSSTRSQLGRRGAWKWELGGWIVCHPVCWGWSLVRQALKRVCWRNVFIVVLLVHKSAYLSIMQDLPLVVPVLTGQPVQHWDMSYR